MSEKTAQPVVDETVLVPESVAEAVASFRAGEPPTVVGGGTIVVPDTRAGRHPRCRTLLLSKAGLDTITRDGSTVVIGAGVTLDRLGDAPAPLGTVAAGIADREIRAQATIGGNLCARSLDSVPRGDLQVPLVALRARVRLATRDSEETVPVEQFLAEPGARLVLAVEVDEEARLVGTARLRRPHTHSYTALHVCVAATPSAGRLTEVRVVAGGATDRAVRLSNVESALEGVTTDDADPSTVVAHSLAGLAMRTDALASAWYREQVLPVLLRRACAELLGREEQTR